MPGSADHAENILYGGLSPRERLEPERPGWWPVDGIRPEWLYYSAVDVFQDVEGWSGVRNSWMAQADLPDAWLREPEHQGVPTGAYGLRRDAIKVIEMVSDPYAHWADMYLCELEDEAEWDEVRLSTNLDSYAVDQYHLAAVTYLVGPDLEWRVVSQINDLDAEYRNRHYLFCRRPGLEQPLGILDINVV